MATVHHCGRPPARRIRGLRCGARISSHCAVRRLPARRANPVSRISVLSPVHKMHSSSALSQASRTETALTSLVRFTLARDYLSLLCKCVQLQAVCHCYFHDTTFSPAFIIRIRSVTRLRTRQDCPHRLHHHRLHRPQESSSSSALR